VGSESRQELPEEINELTSRIIKAAMEVHTELGPGLYEKVYRKAMAHELPRMGMAAESELPLAVVYKGELIDTGAELPGSSPHLPFLLCPLRPLCVRLLSSLRFSCLVLR